MKRMWTVSIFVVGVVCLSSFAAAQQPVERFAVVFFEQQGSGLRVVGIGSDTTRKQAGTFVRLKNYAWQRVVGFELAFVAAGDARLLPDTKVGPEIVKRSGYVETAIDPGTTYDVYSIGPAFDEFLPRWKQGGARFGIVRAGVMRVVYADGSEQNFDLLKDEQATKSTPPPDLGGHPNPTKKPTSMNDRVRTPMLNAARLRVTAQVPRCDFRVEAIPADKGGSYFYTASHSESITISLDPLLARPPEPPPEGAHFPVARYSA